MQRPKLPDGWGDRTLHDYLAVILRGKWIILTCFVLVFGAALLYIKFADRVYRATTSVRIDVKAAESSIFQQTPSYIGNLNIIQNELQVLKSNALADVVARRLIDLRYVDSAKTIPIQIIEAPQELPGKGGLASVEMVSSRVQSSVEFEPVRESDVIKISAASKSPEEAALIANAYVQAYFDRNIFASRTKQRSFREFLEGQAKDKQAALAKSEESLRRYMEEKGVVSLDDNSKRIIEQLSQLESQRDAVDINIQSLERTLQTYREQVTQQEQSVAKVMGEANDPYIERLQAQLAQLEVQRDITVAQNPDYVGKEVYNAQLKEIDGQIQSLKAKLKKRTDEFLTNLLPGVASSAEQHDPAAYLRQVKQKMLESQVELQALQARRTALTDAIREYNRQFENLPRKNMDFARLQREKLSMEKLYLNIEEKYNEANISEQREAGYIDIFDPAVIPGAPSSPKVMITLLLGIVGGLGLGLLIVFGREYMKEVLRTPEDVKKRGFTPMSTIMLMGSSELRRHVNGKSGTEAQVAPQLVMITNPLAPVAESYRHLRTNIHLAHRTDAPQTLLVSSPDEGEGKTTTVANLAVAFARSGKRTVLVDGDLRRPTLFKVFNVRMKPGLHEMLAGVATLDECLQRTPVEDLNLLTSGSIPQNPAEYLGSDRMQRLIEELKEQFDVILFDAPPVLAVTDASVIATQVDRVILVISSGKTPAQDFDRAVETLDAVGVKVSGVVLNNFNPKRAYGAGARVAGYGYYGVAYRSDGTRSNGKDGGKVKARST
ncbi:MAG TPA: polysaccharide biosynthesis tyrosine autokinase [Bacteroidota bacterium]